MQCKTARIEDNGTVVASDTVNHNVAEKNRQRRHYQGQCDYFAVFCEELNKVYLIPVDQVGTNSANLRLVPAKNNQVRNVQWAKDYEYKWAQLDSNQRPTSYEPAALTTELWALTERIIP